MATKNKILRHKHNRFIRKITGYNIPSGVGYIFDPETPGYNKIAAYVKTKEYQLLEMSADLSDTSYLIRNMAYNIDRLISSKKNGE